MQPIMRPPHTWDLLSLKDHNYQPSSVSFQANEVQHISDDDDEDTMHIAGYHDNNTKQTSSAFSPVGTSI